MGNRIVDRYNLLTDHIENSRLLPFEWGKNDCVTFALRYVEKLIDKDLVDRFCIWKSEEEAEKKIKVFGKDLIEATTNCADGLGLRKKDVRFLKRTDILVIDGINGQTIAICVGDKLIAPGPVGIVFMPIDLSKIYACFEVL